MNIESLREYIQIGLQCSLSKAAASMHIAQPTLSKHVAALEKECDAVLLERTPTGVALTPAGQVLFEEAFGLVRSHDTALKRVRSLKKTCTVNLSGLYMNPNVAHAVNNAILRINSESSLLSVSSQSHDDMSCIDIINSHLADFVFTILTKDEVVDGCEKRFLFSEPMICMVKEGHPFLKKERLHVKDLNNQAILQPVGSYSTEHGRTTTQAIAKRYDLALNERATFVRNFSDLFSVENTGAALIMESSLLEAMPPASGYHTREFYEEDLRFDFYVLYDKRIEGDSLKMQFLESLVNEASYIGVH